MAGTERELFRERISDSAISEEARQLERVLDVGGQTLADSVEVNEVSIEQEADEAREKHPKSQIIRDRATETIRILDQKGKIIFSDEPKARPTVHFSAKGSLDELLAHGDITEEMHEQELVYLEQAILARLSNLPATKNEVVGQLAILALPDIQAAVENYLEKRNEE